MKGKNKLRIKINLENEIVANLANEKVLNKIAKYVLKTVGQKKAQVSATVYYVDAKKIQQVNKEYRDKDIPTDVLSFRLIENKQNLPLKKKYFPLEFDPATKTIYLGEIFICREIAKEQAKEYGNSENRETLELFIHGMLHLLGCDHHKPEETDIMKSYEEKMMKVLDKKKII